MRQIRPSRNRNESRIAIIEALESRRLLSTIYSADMTGNPGWAFDTGWGYGTPVGVGGDPSSGHTGAKVVGTIIASPGTYPNSVPSTYYATTAVIDCSSYTGVTFSFWRYLGVLAGDTARIGVSNNGTTWTSVWSNSGASVVDTSWSLQTYNISAVADRQSTVYIRWGLGPTDANGVSFGWNLDDVTVNGTLDTTPPSIVNESPADGDEILSSSFNVDVFFSEPVRGVDATDLVLSGRAAASAVVGTPVNIAGNQWRFPVSGAVDGRLTFTLGADVGDITDTAGNSLRPNLWDCRVNITRKIAFSSKAGGNCTDVYVVNEDGTDTVNLTNTPYDSESSPVFSPDGQRIAFVSDIDGVNSIYLMRPDGTGITRLTTPPDYSLDYEPAFSPDGMKIAFSRYTGTNNSIYLINADGTGLTLLATGDCRSPAYSPDGTKIAFYQPGVSPNDLAIYTMNAADGTGMTRLTPTTYQWNYSPRYSPDGSKIVFCSYRDGNYEIYAMDATGTGQTRLTNNTASDTAPAFSLDGSKIAFASDRGGSAGLYTMLADGSSQLPVAGTSGAFGSSCWGYDHWAPTVSAISRVGPVITNSTIVQFSVTFREAVVGVDTSDFALATAGSAAGVITSVTGSGRDYTVTVGSVVGDGTLGLNVVDNDSIEDRVGYRLGGDGVGNGDFAGPLYTADHAAPTVTSLSRSSSAATNASSVSFEVSFSESVSGVDASDFALALTGTAVGSISSVKFYTSYWLVTVDSVTGDGTLGLNLLDNDTIVDSAGNKLGGSGTGNGNFTGQAYTVDHTAPVVVSINRLDANPTNGIQARWTVTFSESVSSVIGADFSVMASGATGTLPTGFNPVSGSGSSYTVLVVGVSGNGTLTLRLVDRDTIVDAAGNVLVGVGTPDGSFTGQAYRVDHTFPGVSALGRVDATPTNATNVLFYLGFSEVVSGVDTSDFALVLTGNATGSIAEVYADPSDPGRRYWIRVTDLAGDGSLGLNLVDDDSIRDLAGNYLGGYLAGNGDFTGETYVLDHTAPGLVSTVVNGAAVQRSMVTEVGWTFSEAVNLDTGAFSLVRRSDGLSIGLLVTPSGGGTIHTLTFTGMVGGSLPDGVYDLTLTGSRVHDLAGNPMAADHRLRFHRLFGDYNGDRIVNRTDLLAFRQTLNKPASYASYFDDDNDGAITLTDYLQFRKRLLRQVLR